MSAPNDSGPPTGSSEAPTLELLLEDAPPVARQVYDLVRSVLEDFEASAPWSTLHSPPESMADLLRLLDGLLEVIDSIPDRFVSLQGRLADLPAEVETSQDLVDARFFFEGIHGMVVEDIDQLRRMVEPLRQAPIDLLALPPERKAYLCEVSADLKGKYASALMGAAASLVAGEARNSVAIEPVLFEEKAEEFRRNRRLVKALIEVLDRLQKLHSVVPWEETVRRWESARSLDPYVMRPVVAFVDVLGKLLEGDVRRALYSGDYHEIRERRRALASRVNALSTLLLMESGVPHEADVDGQRRLMVRRAAEIAALLDREELLPLVVGREAVERLESLAGSAGEAPGLPPTLELLLPLVEEEDLETFLKRILRAVLRRGSLVLERKKRRLAERRAGAAGTSREQVGLSSATVAAPGDGSEAQRAEVSVDGSGSTSPADAEPDREVTSEAGPPGSDAPQRVEDTPSPGRAAPRAEPQPGPKDDGPAAAAAAPVTEEERRELRRSLAEALRRLRSPDDPRRKPFDFMHRMLDRQAVIPPGMVRSIHPFLGEIEAEILPRVARLAAGGDLPRGSEVQLQRSLAALGDPSPPPAWIRMEMAPAMGRVSKYLDALASAVGDGG